MGRHATTNIDWITAILLLLIGLFGLFILLTIDSSLFIQQSIFLFIGVILFWLASRIDYAILMWFAPLGYVASVLFLALSYTGPVIRGATRWILIGNTQIQPSEVVKPFMLLAFAWLVTKFPPRELKYIPLHFVLFLIPFLLVFRQPDLGSSLVYAGQWIAIMVAGGFPVIVLVLGSLVGGGLAPFLWNHLHEYQRLRVLTFLNPFLDPKGAGYNALQAMIAVGSGRLFGRGLGLGTQSHLRFLPEYHTDFIFATLIEELGFMGGMLLLGAYFILLWRLVSRFFRGNMDDVFVFAYTFGLFTMLIVQVFINTGMNMGVLPITGITLPLVSYGGSSILSIALSFGFLEALRRKQAVTPSIAIS